VIPNGAQADTAAEKACAADPRVLKDVATSRDIFPILNTVVVVTGEVPVSPVITRQ
jgi:hypothetical protein